MALRQIKVTAFFDSETYAMLEHMAKADGLVKAAFLRRLVQAEWLRRFSQPNPAVSVTEAIEAGEAIHISSIEQIGTRDA